jgi:hypothetical protein
MIKRIIKSSNKLRYTEKNLLKNGGCLVNSSGYSVYDHDIYRLKNVNIDMLLEFKSKLIERYDLTILPEELLTRCDYVYKLNKYDKNCEPNKIETIITLRHIPIKYLDLEMTNLILDKFTVYTILKLPKYIVYKIFSLKPYMMEECHIRLYDINFYKLLNTYPELITYAIKIPRFYHVSRLILANKIEVESYYY